MTIPAICQGNAAALFRQRTLVKSSTCFREVIDISADFITQQGKTDNFIIANLPDYDFCHDDKSLISYGMQKFHASLMASAQDMFELVNALANSNNLSFARTEARKILRDIENNSEWLEDVYNYKQKSGWDEF